MPSDKLGCHIRVYEGTAQAVRIKHRISMHILNGKRLEEIALFWASKGKPKRHIEDKRKYGYY